MKHIGARFYALDGLRGISLVGLLVGHLAGTVGFPLQVDTVRPLASLGVRVFFVISGFLITRLLLIELEDTGRIRLPRFYFRRTLRIMLPYYCLLAGTALAAHLGWVQLGPGDLTAALTYTTNYHQHGLWVLGHTWSLSVEEQFYLLWPALIVVLGPRVALRLAAAFIVAAPFARLCVWYFQPELRAGIGHTFGTAADAIAWGCLLAGWGDRLAKSTFYRSLLDSKWVWLAPALVVAMSFTESRPRTVFTVGSSIMNAGIFFWMHRCLRLPEARATRFLCWRPFVVMGTVSYSVYLWQQLFLNRYSTAWANVFPYNILLAVPVAIVAFILIEKPCMRVREPIESWFARLPPLFKLRIGMPRSMSLRSG